jgi:uncharacterized membrane protein
MIDSSHFHPMAVHFPIALIMVGFVIDLISLSRKHDPCLPKVGYYLMILGMAGALAAWGTGYYFTAPMAGEAGLARDNHELFATLTLVTIILATLFRILITYLKKETTYLRWIVLGMFFLAFLLVIYTGFLGGRLVREFMMGI